MFRPFVKKFLLILLVGLLSHCFGGGIDKRGTVKGYRYGIVTTLGGSFRVGTLPSHWKRKSFRYRALLFAHNNLDASIEVQAFCKRAFDDGPLHLLTNQLHYGLTQERRIFQKKIRLDDREALRTVQRGQVDGSSIVLDSVVLKMNECVFDFVAVSVPEHYSRIKSDFEHFFNGFEYVSGPPVD